jgi:hypothetical protein
LGPQAIAQSSCSFGFLFNANFYKKISFHEQSDKLQSFFEIEFHVIFKLFDIFDNFLGKPSCPMNIL